MGKRLIKAVMEKTGENYTVSEIVHHYTYIQDKLLSKIAFKTLYKVIPTCLNHYWDIDGPTYCSKCPLSFEVDAHIKLPLLRIVKQSMYELHFEEEGLLRYLAFFRMLPLIQMYKY
jgi:hypothetical protein